MGSAQLGLVPDNYGSWWSGEHCDERWYGDIFALRREAHDHFIAWLAEAAGPAPIASTLEVGCGRHKFYREALKAYGYHGCDIAAPAIAACQERYPELSENFFVADALRDDLRGPYDLVFSHAVIDHVGDIDLFLTRLAAASRRLLFVSCYTGWQNGLDEHRYRWVEGRACFKNQISPTKARRVLEAIGCRDINIYPVPGSDALGAVITAVAPEHG